MQTHYNQKILTEAIAKSGVKEGDIVFCHSNIGYFGIPEEGADTKTICSLVLDAFISVLGEKGTFVSPTFTYSFGSDNEDKVFDPDNTPSGMGVFAEMIRRHPSCPAFRGTHVFRGRPGGTGRGTGEQCFR